MNKLIRIFKKGGEKEGMLKLGSELRRFFMLIL